MSGIAFIVPNADFSNSPLGTVTVQKTAEEKAAEVVATYTTEIGDSTYSSELTQMVADLIRIGAWENLDIYPMLGDSLADMKVNLNPTDGYLKSGLLFGSNAEYITNGIRFSVTEDGGESLVDNPGIESDNFQRGAITNSEGLYILADLKRQLPLNGQISRLYACNPGSAPIYFASTGFGYVSLDVSSNNFNGNVQVNGDRTIASFALDSSKAYCYTNGGEAVQYDITSNSTSPLMVANYLGATPAHPTEAGYMFNGEVKFWVIGRIAASKASFVNNIFKTFLDAVKPNSSSNETNQ